MRSSLFRRALLGSLVLFCLAVAGSPTAIAAQEPVTAPVDTQDDNGFDEGLLGLAGLAGLLGLKRRNEVKRSQGHPNDANRAASRV